MDSIDLTQQIPAGAQMYLGAGGIVIISVIFILLFISFKRFKSKFIPLLIGVVAYILFGYLLYNGCAALFLSIPGMYSAYNAGAVPPIMITTAIVALLYTIARIIISKCMDKSLNSAGDSINYGIGLGLGNAVLYALTVLMLMTFASAVETNGMTGIFEQITNPEELQSIYDSYRPIFTNVPYVWLLLGLSYSMDIVLNAGLAVIVTGVSKGKIPKVWYVLTGVINFAVLLPYDLYDGTTAIGSILPFVIKSVLFVAAIYIIVRVNKQYQDGSLNGKGPKMADKPMPKFGKLNQL